MTSDKQRSLVELFSGSIIECQIIKNLLENENIESHINNQIIGTRGGNVFRPAG